MKTQPINRRQFTWLATCVLGGACLPLNGSQGREVLTAGWDPSRPFKNPGKKLRVRPLLMYTLPAPREAASWKSWGGVQTERAVSEEVRRIEWELKRLGERAEFGLEILPLEQVSTTTAVAGLARQEWDVTLLYACTGGGSLLEACLQLQPHSLVFVRHRSGPVYYWYEALSIRYLQGNGAGEGAGLEKSRLTTHVEDVVVDDYAEVLWKLRALYAVKNFLGSCILALGGPWGKYAPDAPEKSQERFGLKVVDVSYKDFGPRVAQALSDPTVMSAAEASVRRYLKLPATRLKTDRAFVVKAFVLYGLFKDLMKEHEATAFTIKSCMGTILPMAHTTACLSLSLLNDEGLTAFCESDFVVIPAGLLLRQVVGRPVFLHNSTFPHQGLVTCAHCTSPRRLDGRRYEPAEILTHYESEYGAATKVAVPPGKEVTFINPEYSTNRWLGFKGTVKANPSYEICRSQQDVQIQGDWRKLLAEVRDSHWVMAYGDWLKELSYAARKVGVQWSTIPGMGQS